MAAKIIAVAQAKGGVGKSTLCANLATTFIDNNATLLIDCDPPQHSICAWHQVREQTYESTGLTVLNAARPADLLKLLEKHHNDFDVIILDGPPHINAMTRAMVAIASLVLVPLAPSSIEIWSFEQMDELMQSVKSVNPDCEARICWTRVRKRVYSSEYLIADVKKSSHIKPIANQLTQRVAYVDSFAEGLTVYEWKDHVARTEFWSLFSAVQRILRKCTHGNLAQRDKVMAFSKL